MLQTSRACTQFILLTLAMIMAASCAPSVTDNADSGTESVRRFVQQANLESAHCGILVQHVTTGEVIMSMNSERLFAPASTMKIMTTYAALLQLGPDYHFQTSLWMPTAGQAPGTIDHIVLRGGGDPFLGDKEWDEAAPAAFQALASALSARGITKIEGDLIVDASLYGDELIPADWSWGDVDRFYGAPVSSMNAGHNVVIADIRPGRGVDSPASVRIVPDLASHITLVTSAVTAAGNRRTVSATLRRASNTIEVAGTIGLERESARLAVAVQDPARYAGLWFRRALQRHGIECAGAVRVTYEPIDFRAHERVSVHESDPLVDIASRILVESDNLGAECLARHLQMATAGEPATDPKTTGETGALAVLQRRGLPASPQLSIIDGSGLSRTNLLAPSHLTWALIEATREDEFLFASIVPRAEGHSKMGTHPMAAEHRVRVAAKTGSFQGTRCFAGYYLDVQGAPQYAFATMVNGLSSDGEPAFAFEALVIDAIGKIAAQN